ncbi:MAG: exopolysaccharide biosynthesis polyprenyl glycosylphosphotransferase [Patescibacteria group bacterium]
MPTIKKLLLAASDVALLFFALAVTLFIRYPRNLFFDRLEDHALPFSAIFLIWLFVFYLADLYRQKSFRTQSIIASELTLATAISAIASVVLFYLFGPFFELAPKTNLLIFTTVFFLESYLWRTFLGAVFRSGRTPVVVIGNSPRIEETARYLEENLHAGYRFAGWIKNASPDELKKIPALVKESGARTIVVQPKLSEKSDIVHAIYSMSPFETAVISFSDFYELILDRVPLDEIKDGWVIEHIAMRRPFYDAAKRLLDILLGLIIGIILSPIALLVTLGIKIDSRGPALFIQERFGKNGKLFPLYKFRTMKMEGHKDNWPLWTEENDPRITSLGKLLRLTHADEVPQLWNIIKGDISFTGPRPERSELAKKYQDIPYYDIRHVVKPGLTGWAQINYKPSSSLEEARAKLEYDIYYVKNRSFVLDLLIIIRTIRYIFVTNK